MTSLTGLLTLDFHLAIPEVNQARKLPASIFYDVKHLTELPWKTLVVKQGVKDLGLQKALVAYAKLDATKRAG